MTRCILTVVAALGLLFVTGCGNLSPRINPNLDQKIDNQNGKIDDIKNNQNGIMGEIGTLKNKADIQDSQLDRVQQGLLNVQNNTDNHGVMILSGSGGLMIAAMTLFTILILGILVFHYRGQAQIHEKTANILAERIVHHNDPALEDSIFEAVLHTQVAANVLHLIKKQKSLLFPE